MIICFCHKLTNYKKSRRYKYDFGRAAAAAGAAIEEGALVSPAAAAAAAAAASALWQQHQQQQQTTGQASTSNEDDDNNNQQQQHHQASLASLSSGSYDPYNTIRPLFTGPFASAQTQQAYLSAGQTFQVPLGAVAYGYHHPAGAAAAVAALQQAAAGAPDNQQQDALDSCPSYEEAVGAAAAEATGGDAVGMAAARAEAAEGEEAAHLSGEPVGQRQES